MNISYAATTIQLRRGTLANLPALQDGEPGWVTDEKMLYIGQDGKSIPVGNIGIDSRGYATIELADAAAYAAGKLLIIAQNHTLTANTVLTAPIMVIPGGSFTQSASWTLTINGSFSNPSNRQCFIGFAAGDIEFKDGTVKGIYTEWYGGKGDGSTDCTSAFAQAEGSAFIGHQTILMGDGIYRVTATSGNYAVTTRVAIKGTSPNNSYIENIGTGSALKVMGQSSNFYYTRMENFGVRGNASSEDGIAVNPAAVSGGEVAYSIFNNVDSSFHGRHGLVHRYAWATKYNNCKFYNNGGLGVYLYPEATELYYHNNIIFQNCESRWNGGTGNAGADYLKGGVRVSGGVQGFYWLGGVVESNNAWGFILGHNTVATAQIMIIKNVNFEDNPRSTSTLTIGGNIRVDEKYYRVEVSNCWGTYGAPLGATGYGFYIAHTSEGSYFKEWGNYLGDLGAGTNVRDYGLTYDWTKPYVSNVLLAGTHTILTMNGAGEWSVRGFVHLKADGSDHGGIYPFTASWEPAVGLVSRIGSSIVKKEGGGLSAAIASGTTIAHGLGVAPDSISILPAETAATDVYATADATNITVTYAGGGTKTFYWRAEYFYTSPALTAPTLSWSGGDLNLVIPATHYGYVEMILGTEYNPPTVFSIPTGTVWNNDLVKRAK